MVRLKFLVFVVVALGAWAAQLVLTAPSRSDAVIADGIRTAEMTANWAVSQLDRQHGFVSTKVLNAAGTPDTLLLASVKGTKASATDRLGVLRDNVLKTFSAEDRRQLGADFLFAFVAADGHAYAQGADGAIEAGDGLPVSELAKAGPEGRVADAFGAPYVVFSLPVFERGNADAIGTVILGAPTLRSTVFAGAKQPVALVAGDKVLAVGGFNSGADESLVQRFLAALGTSQSGVVERGSASALGPLQLPFLTSADPMGGKAPMTVAVRQTLKQPYEIVAFTAVAPAYQKLAAEQQRSLMIFGGLLVLGLVWTILMGGRSAPSKQTAAQEKAIARTSVPAFEAAAEQAAAREERTPEPMTAEPMNSAPEASPDDFPFGTPVPHESAQPSAHAFAAEPAPEPGYAAESDYAAAPDDAQAPPAEEPETSPEASVAAYPLPPPAPFAEPYSEATVVEQLPTAAMFAAASGTPEPRQAASTFAPSQIAPLTSDPYGDDNPEATRVASVPADLLRAAASAGGGESEYGVASHSNGIGVAAPMVPAMAANPDDAHFQEVFREFLSTRERCGEAADGLTFDKFAAKLRKNKEQLVLKHNCKTVRFQVYVKEGKAALKATPIAK